MRQSNVSTELQRPLRYLLALATSAVVGISGAALAAPLTVEDVSIAKSTDQYDVEVHYPRSGLAAVDTAVSGWATGLVDDFVNQAEEDFASFANDNDRPNWTYSLDLNYEVARNDGEMFVVGFQEDIFTGGAHPNHDIETFNFLMPDGWQVFLPEIFDPPALDRISQLAIADLKSQWSGEDAMSDDDWLNTGAGAQWSNFRDFLLLADTLIIDFPPYQVAAYAAGPQEVRIPLSKLKGLMRTDWRTPVPSFDCAKAGTPTEKAICSDVALARLDRDVASVYRQQLSYADDARKTAIRNAQRAWLDTRDACGGSVVCLTDAYDQRLKALQPG